MTKRDYYEVLGISRDATPDEVKRAYRRLAKQHHPDVNKDDPEAEEKFKELAEAYEVLSDPQKRARYDQFGHESVRFGRGGFDWSDFTHTRDFEDLFGDFFGQVFGGFRQAGRRRAAPKKGANLRYDLEITLEEAASGVEREIRFERLEICGNCNGSGAKSPSDIVACPKCGGTGELRKVSSMGGFGSFVSISTCGTCGGKGKVVKTRCPTCGGRGKVHIERTLTVRVPPGVDTGTQLRISGEGELGEGGSGDLYVAVHVAPHDLFERSGNDIFFEAPVSFVQATLGAEIEVPTLDGFETLVIPPGTQHGTTFRLRGKGMPDMRSRQRGDEIVQIRIVIPQKITSRQREILQEFEAEGKKNTRRGVIGKVIDEVKEII